LLSLSTGHPFFKKTGLQGDRGAFHLQIFDQRHRITFIKNGAVAVLAFRLYFLGAYVTKTPFSVVLRDFSNNLRNQDYFGEKSPLQFAIA
jgi:hypothetical protein